MWTRNILLNLAFSKNGESQWSCNWDSAHNLIRTKNNISQIAMKRNNTNGPFSCLLKYTKTVNRVVEMCIGSAFRNPYEKRKKRSRDWHRREVLCLDSFEVSRTWLQLVAWFHYEPSMQSPNCSLHFIFQLILLFQVHWFFYFKYFQKLFEVGGIYRSLYTN